MKKFEFNPGQSFVGILAAVVLGILLAFYSLILLWPQGNPYDSVKVTIPKGASLKEVSTTLQDYNIIRNERSFLLAVKTLGYEKDMPAGRFKLLKASTNFDIIDQLVNGIQVNKRVTILEGWTIDIIADELHDKIGIDKDEFKSACTNELLLWKWGISEKSVEGYLFPNTYLFSEEEDVQDPLIPLAYIEETPLTHMADHLKERFQISSWEDAVELSKSQRDRGSGMSSYRNTTKRITDSVAIYLPPNVTDSTTAAYTGAATGVVGAAAAGAFGVVKDMANKDYEKAAKGKGFLMVSATPLTRSSYHAGDDFSKLKKNILYLSKRGKKQSARDFAFNDLIFLGDSQIIDLFAEIFPQRNKYSIDDAYHQARLARILREGEYDYKTNEVKLWDYKYEQIRDIEENRKVS